MNNTHSNKEDYTPSNKVISRKTKPRSRSSFKQKGGVFSDDFAGLDITGNNYCWLAASIQLLWSIKPLRDFLLQPNLDAIISELKYITEAQEKQKFNDEIAKYTFDNLTAVFKPRGFSRIFFEEKKPIILEDYKSTILALSKVFDLYNSNNDKSKHTQINDKTVMNVLEDAGKKSDSTSAQGTEIQRTCGDFILYIFKLFQISTNNNKLLKTFSYYRLEIIGNEESVFSNEFILLLSPDGKTKNMTMQQLIDHNGLTNPIQFASESKNILIMLNHEGNAYGNPDSDNEKREVFMNKSISAHQKININNSHYKLRGCVVYTGDDKAGHYIYMVFPDNITEQAVKLDGSGKTRQQPIEYEGIIQVRGNIYLYEKEELLVDATDDELAASTLTLVATTILGEEQLTTMAQRFNNERLEALRKQIQLKAAARLQQEQAAAAERTRLQQEQAAAAERTRLQQEQAAAAERTRLQEAERTRLQQEEGTRVASGRIRRLDGDGTVTRAEAEDNIEVEPADPYRYAESSDYGSSAENIVLGTLLCITIIISTVMLSK
jgi:hypothetical protein